MELKEEFGISVELEDDSAQSISTVQDAADLIEDIFRRRCKM
jgi:acyl carrier protein